MVATDKWQRITEFEVCEGRFLMMYCSTPPLICDRKLGYALTLLQVFIRCYIGTVILCFTDVATSEFLIHAADVEGLCQGIDELLVQSG